MRLFSAIYPPPSVQRDVDATVRLAPGGPRLRWTAADKLHLTLVFLGDVPASREREVIASADAAAAAVGRFEVRLNGLGAFPDLSRPRVLFVRVREGGDALVELWRRQVEALPQDLRPHDGRELHPHLTLARPKKPVAAGELKRLAEELECWQWRFEADELRLVQSRLSVRGARYEVKHVTGLLGE
jgi:2'-5' RNA ligase